MSKKRADSDWTAVLKAARRLHSVLRGVGHTLPRHVAMSAGNGNIILCLYMSKT